MISHIRQPEEEVKEELAFRPAINQKSERLAGARWSTRTRDEAYQLLHAEAALKEGRKEEARKENASHLLDGYTFHPVFMTNVSQGGREGRKKGGREGIDRGRDPREDAGVQGREGGREARRPSQEQAGGAISSEG